MTKNRFRAIMDLEQIMFFIKFLIPLKSVSKQWH